METTKLVELVGKAKNGDETARQALYLDSGKRVYFLAHKLLRDENDAEDIMQDVFITVFDKLHELREPAAYYKWVSRVTANRCASFLRKIRPMPFEEQDLLDALELEDEGEAFTPESLYDDAETRRLIMEIIDELPESQRMCILYRYFNQLSIEEIAAITETNEYTVKSRLALARKKIRAAILLKEEKEDIRLHAFLPIMPVLTKALEEFRMPVGVAERIWARVAEGTGSSANKSEVGEQANYDRFEGEFDMRNQNRNYNGAGEAGAPTPAGVVGAAKMGAGVVKAGLSLGAKIAIAAGTVVVAAGLFVGGGILLPRLISSSGDAAVTPAQGMAESVEDTAAQEIAGHPPEQPAADEEPDLMADKNVYTLVCYSDTGFSGIAIAFHEDWGEDVDLGNFDIEDLTVYVNGVPNAVTSYRVEPWDGYPRGVAAYHIWFDPEFTQHPAEFRVSVTMKGVELTQDDFSIAEADENGDFTVRANGGVEHPENTQELEAIAPTAQNGFTEAQEATIVVNGETYTGTYEGEYKDGLFSGYGVWEYGGWTYEGYWVNGLPNGNGALRSSTSLYEGEFVDGMAHGSITLTVNSRGTHTWVYDVNMGYSSEEKIQNENGTVFAPNAIVGVPPWGMKRNR